MGQASDEVRFAKRTDLTLLDLGGAEKIRGIWPRYFAEVHGFVYVVDASDRNRFGEAKTCLHGVLGHAYVNGKPFAVIANKVDCPGAATPAEVDEALGVGALSDGGGGSDGAAAHSVPCVALASRPRRPHAGITRAMRNVLVRVVESKDTLEPRREADMAAHAIEAAAALAAKKARVDKIRADRARKAALAEAAEESRTEDESGGAEPGVVHPAAAAAADAEIAPPMAQSLQDPTSLESQPEPDPATSSQPLTDAEQSASPSKPFKRARRNQVAPM